MAIYPITNAYVINKDAVVGSTFKAGMILMSNSTGKVVPADSQTLISKTINEKQIAIVGVAAGDYNISGNTIIVPDYIGSNYLDSNSNFVSSSDREFLSIRRQLLDYADETVNEYYNINYSPKPFRTGIGVYPLLGDTFITDQFVPVLHGDFGFDYTVTQTINPGDLLTIGGGINAGKLVKVNVNSFGPEVLVVGIVDKYVTSTGLLHYRQIQSSLKFNNLYILYSDPGNLSFLNSATSMKNFANLSQSISINNGAIPTSYYISYDGTNDNCLLPTSSATYSEGTFIAWVYPEGIQDQFDGIIFSAPDRPSASGIMFFGSTNLLGYHWAGGYNASSLVIPANTWSFCCFSVSGSGTIYSVNGVFQTGGGLGPGTFYDIFLATDPLGRYMKGRISLASFINKALTQTEITNYYNATKYRYV